MQWALKQTGSPRERHVLLLLAMWADGNGCSYYVTGSLANYTGMSERTVKRTVQALVQRGLIEVEPSFWPNGSQRGNDYRLLLPCAKPCVYPVNNAAAGAVPLHGGVCLVTPYTEDPQDQCVLSQDPSATGTESSRTGEPVDNKAAAAGGQSSSGADGATWLRWVALDRAFQRRYGQAWRRRRQRVRDQYLDVLAGLSDDAFTRALHLAVQHNTAPIGAYGFMTLLAETTRRAVRHTEPPSDDRVRAVRAQLDAVRRAHHIGSARRSRK